MKIWFQYGSEHSANLVMIGHFKDVTEAVKAKGVIDVLSEKVAEEQSNGTLVLGSPSSRYSTEMLNLMSRLKVASIGPAELEQLAYDVRVELEGNKVVLTTDEHDISAFLKIMIHRGARIEVYSAHYHPSE